MSDRFDRAIALFDAANAEDPNLEDDENGAPVARELLYARRMSGMLDRTAPQACDAVRLAVRAQHIRRWEIARRDYPMTPAGYHQWRSTLYGFHAALAARLLGEAGYDGETIARVKAAVGKRDLARNPDSQLVEDVASLVFLEHYLAGFAALHPEYDEAKWAGILRKTWHKMSQDARRFALSGALRLPPALLPLIEKTVSAA